MMRDSGARLRDIPELIELVRAYRSEATSSGEVAHERRADRHPHARALGPRRIALVSGAMGMPKPRTSAQFGEQFDAK